MYESALPMAGFHGSSKNTRYWPSREQGIRKEEGDQDKVNPNLVNVFRLCLVLDYGGPDFRFWVPITRVHNHAASRASGSNMMAGSGATGSLIQGRL